MEDRRSLIILLVFSFVMFCVITPATAYNTDLTENFQHQEINKYATLLVQKWIENDPQIKNHIMFSDAVVKGIKLDGTPDQKSMSYWIQYGGYAEDWDGLFGARSALKHFYDPITGKGLNNALIDDINISGYRSVSATEWATSSENMFSYERAQYYYRQGLKGSDEDYGKAWRSLGQTMHLVSDMTVPSHVRNDAHPPPFWADPYETVTTTESIRENANEELTSPSIDYDTFRADHNVAGLMHRIATWTANNFYSQDSIPKLDIKDQKPDGLFYKTVDDQQVPSATATWYEGIIEHRMQFNTGNGPQESTYRVNETLGLYKVEDKRILDEQKRLLIPNAIHGSAMVLWEFLPRFSAYLDKPTPIPGKAGEYSIKGGLNFQSSSTWPNRPTVCNGAFIVINNNNPIQLPTPPGCSESPSSDFGTITYTIKANPGDKVSLYYDFGGYQINSNTVTVSSTETPSPTATITKPTTKPTIWIDTGRHLAECNSSAFAEHCWKGATECFVYADTGEFFYCRYEF